MNTCLTLSKKTPITETTDQAPDSTYDNESQIWVRKSDGTPTVLVHSKGGSTASTFGETTFTKDEGEGIDISIGYASEFGESDGEEVGDDYDRNIASASEFGEVDMDEEEDEPQDIKRLESY